MEKKEFYRHALPHFQKPGQAYFVTWCLKDAIPPKALDYYTIKIRNLQNELNIQIKNKVDDLTINLLNMEFNSTRKKYIKAFNDLLDLQEKCLVNLSKDSNRDILHEAINFWEGKRIENHAYCIMSNHVHWVFKVFENDNKNKSVFLQDILQSVKHFSANEINKNEGIKGSLWQKESFDTTIRDDVHLFNAINYTINNPVKAGLVNDWKQWKGTRLFGEILEDS
jgi:putative transposase